MFPSKWPKRSWDQRSPLVSSLRGRATDSSYFHLRPLSEATEAAEVAETAFRGGDRRSASTRDHEEQQSLSYIIALSDDPASYTEGGSKWSGKHIHFVIKHVSNHVSNHLKNHLEN